MTDPNDPRLPWGEVLSQRVADLLKPGAPPVHGYTTGGASTVTGPVDVAGLLALMKPLEERRRKIDQGLVDGLWKLMWETIRSSGGSLDFWADRLGIDRGKFARVMAGEAEPDWWFWEAVRAYFAPRKEPGDDQR